MLLDKTNWTYIIFEHLWSFFECEFIDCHIKNIIVRILHVYSYMQHKSIVWYPIFLIAYMYCTWLLLSIVNNFFFFNYCLPWITSLWIKWIFAIISDNERIRNRYQFFKNYALWSSWKDIFFDVMICFLCKLFCVYEDFIIANEGLQILNLYMLSAHGHWAFMEGSLLCHTKCNMEHLFLRSSTRNQDFYTCYWVSVTIRGLMI